MMALPTLAERLKKARRDKGLGVRELGQLAGVDPGYISALESGKRDPGRGRSLAVMKLMAALDLSAGVAGVAETRSSYVPVKNIRDRKAFTALVEALLKIERLPESTDGPEEESRFQVAWKLVTSVSTAVRMLAGFDEADWDRTMKLDHWKKLTKEPEELTIRRALD